MTGSIANQCIWHGLIENLAGPAIEALICWNNSQKNQFCPMKKESHLNMKVDN